MTLEQFIAKNLQADGFDIDAEKISLYIKTYEFICAGAIDEKVLEDVRQGIKEANDYV